MRLYYKDRATAEAVRDALRQIAPVFACPFAPEMAAGPFMGHYYVEASDELWKVLQLAAIAFPPIKTREILTARLRLTIKDGE